jgi:hypothetical protein
LEEEIRQRGMEKRRKREMPISGRSVFQIQQIMNQKTDHHEKKK